jgi:KAP family P-loop domain
MIDEARRAKVTRWIEQMDPRALDEEAEEDRRRYVDLDAWMCSDGKLRSLRGHTVEFSGLNKIFDSILVTPSGSTHLFAGFPGTGKTTELNRLTRLLKGNQSPGFSVVRVNARKYHGMRQALSIEEMVVLLAAGIGEAAFDLLGDKALSNLKKEGIWEYIHTRLHAVLADGVTLKLVVADLKPALFRGGDSLGAKLREALGEKLHEKLREFLHGLVMQIVESIAPRQLVILVDDLEKYSVSREHVAQVYQETADLFFLHETLLKLPGCHTVYTVPPYLAFLNPGIRSTFKNNVHTLPSVKVQSRPPERTPYHDGIEALTRMMSARIDLDELFGSNQRECMRRLVLASGGHLRDLINLTKDVALLALRRDLPLTIEAVEDVISQAGSDRGSIFHRDLEVLLEVSKHGTLSSVEDKRLAALAAIMDQHLLLCYANKTFWYDAHPLIIPMLDEARASQDVEE